MLEAVQCPQCSTRYGLRRERVKPVHARAQCHGCRGLFPIREAVVRLLDLPPLEVPEDATATMGFQVEDLEFTQGGLIPLPEPAPVAPPEPEFLEPSAEVPEVAELDLPSAEVLSADDLLLGDQDILEKTLVTDPAPTPEIRTSPNLPEPLPDERTASGHEEASALPSDGRSTGSYRSAKDAISQLFGETPLPTPARPRKETSNGAFELEATLDALDHTLGGTEVPKAPEAAAPAPAPEPLRAAEPEFEVSSSATQRLSLTEMQAAIAAAAAVPDHVPAPAPAAPAPDELEANEVTQMVDASRLARRPDPAATHPAPSLGGEAGGALNDDPNLLRLKIGEEVYPNLSLEQLSRWVEEGRVIESHLVARQFSENWIEAHKVPGLRPIFERIKRLRASGPDALESAPAKKSLFGGLFGKKEG